MDQDREQEIPFGKYRGAMLKELPNNYLGWMARAFEDDKEWKHIAADELAYRKKHKIDIDQDDVVVRQDKRDPYTGPRTHTKSASDTYIAPKAIDSASILLFDQYLKVRDNWDEKPGFYTWMAKLVRHHLDAGKFEQFGTNLYMFHGEDYADIGFEISHPSNSHEPGLAVTDVIKRAPKGSFEQSIDRAQEAGKKSKKKPPQSRGHRKGEKPVETIIVDDDDPPGGYDDYATSLPDDGDGFGHFDPSEPQDEEPPF